MQPPHRTSFPAKRIGRLAGCVGVAQGAVPFASVRVEALGAGLGPNWSAGGRAGATRGASPPSAGGRRGHAAFKSREAGMSPIGPCWCWSSRRATADPGSHGGHEP